MIFFIRLLILLINLAFVDMQNVLAFVSDQVYFDH